MEHSTDLEKFIGLSGTVVPCDGDDFVNEFYGTCIGVRNSFLQMRDMEDDVFEVEVSQFTPES